MTSLFLNTLNPSGQKSSETLQREWFDETVGNQLVARRLIKVCSSVFRPDWLPYGVCRFHGRSESKIDQASYRVEDLSRSIRPNLLIVLQGKTLFPKKKGTDHRYSTWAANSANWPHRINLPRTHGFRWQRNRNLRLWPVGKRSPES